MTTGASPIPGRSPIRARSGWPPGPGIPLTRDGYTLHPSQQTIPGHWEGDLILGLESSAIGTLVERTTRFTMLLHLPRLEGHGDGPRAKNGPALAVHGAEAVLDVIARTIVALPDELCRSLNWDQGAEMAQHATLKIDTGLEIYFCDPRSPWQRGTNENRNGLLRQYFPKGTDLRVRLKTAMDERHGGGAMWETG